MEFWKLERGQTYVQNENRKRRLFTLTAQVLLRNFHVLFQFPDSIFKSRTGVVHLVHDENVLADQVGHLQRAQIQPLRPRNLGSGDLLGVIEAEILVERQTNRLNRNVGLTRALQEGAREMDALARCIEFLLAYHMTGHTGGFEQEYNHRRQWRSSD